MARELNASGITVAIPSYSLCPAVSVMEIGDEIQQCLAALWRQTKTRPVVVGHSAGGHLTAEMLARDWSGFAGVPADLVRRGCAISGVFDLAPLIEHQPQRGDRPHQRHGACRQPHVPRAATQGTPAHCCGRRRRERGVPAPEPGHCREAGARSGVDATCLVVDGTNHFTIVDELIRPDSELLALIVALAREEAAS